MSHQGEEEAKAVDQIQRYVSPISAKSWRIRMTKEHGEQQKLEKREKRAVPQMPDGGTTFVHAESPECGAHGLSYRAPDLLCGKSLSPRTRRPSIWSQLEPG
ncbi:hypothetical protein N7462_008343 [Penicillium macrosclerotiorum]|uniref:uncharacterized protein n=1 Tax=Penicillium macrosclerotiorum TaxID=303699 RepID=UPI002547516B|nr:uncharacterized protein N7462_008343 [Penicillium macrosclerotiorum]KAJ5675446.1 hypothetical protein N7462_008343 [Penicillium macrosclerotiorum]